MTDRDGVIGQIYRAIDEVNLLIPAGQRLTKSERTALIGADGALDSLAFLNLIVATEENIASLCGVTIPLASKLMESDRDQLPRTIAELADVICRILNEHGHA